MRNKPFKISRSDALELFKQEIQLLENSIRNKGGRITNLNYAGSLRREKPEVGDLDGIIATNDIDILRSALEENNYNNIFSNLVCKKKISFGDKIIDLDLFVSENYNWGNTSLWSCGSEFFNVSFDKHLNQNGYNRKLYKIYKENYDNDLNFKNEESIFKYFDLKFIEPKDRNIIGILKWTNIVYMTFLKRTVIS